MSFGIHSPPVIQGWVAAPETFRVNDDLARSEEARAGTANHVGFRDVGGDDVSPGMFPPGMFPGHALTLPQMLW